MEKKNSKLTILGAGPGGYVAAIRAGQLGIKTILVEMERSGLGGTCLNRGCIPTKSLLQTVKAKEISLKHKDYGLRIDGEVKIDLKSAVERSKKIIKRLRNGIEFLLKKNGIEIIYGRGRVKKTGKEVLHDPLTTKNLQHYTSHPTLLVEVEGICEIETENIILATGGKPKELPFAPFDGEKIISTTQALEITTPPEEVVIVGGGAAGIEIGLIWSACGSRVTVIEILDRILPFADEDAAGIVEKACRKRGINIMTATRITSIEKSGSLIKVFWQNEEGNRGEITAEKVLVTAGTNPCIENLWDSSIQINIRNGFIETDSNMKTSVEGIYAIGDISGPPLLAHKASHEGIIAVESIAGIKNQSTPLLIPQVVYSFPQIAQIGFTKKQAEKMGMDTVIGNFPFSASGMALAEDETEGFVKIICEAKSGKILGGTIAGVNAGELISEIEVAINAQMTAKEFAQTIHPHPTLSEAIAEASLDAFSRAIHK